TRIHALRLRLHQHGGVRLRSAVVYVNGRVVKRLGRGRVTAPFVLSHLPRSSFTVKVVARARKGKKLLSLVTTKHYANCSKPPPKCTNRHRLRLGVPQRRGDRAVRVEVFLRGRRSKVVRRHSVTHVTLRNL